LPPAAEEIIFLLAKHASLTLEEIMDTIGETSEKTLRYAMRRLLENKVVKRIPNLLDMRSVSYRLASPDEISEVIHELSDHIAEKILAAVERGSDRAYI
jgi:DNA-binding Lrp family transcriptional regulator